MNAFNRIVMLIIALLLIAVPVLLLLVAFGVVSEDLIDAYTGYRSAVESLGNLSLSDITGTVRVVIAIVGLLVALIALLLLLRVDLRPEGGEEHGHGGRSRQGDRDHGRRGEGARRGRRPRGGDRVILRLAHLQR